MLIPHKLSRLKNSEAKGLISYAAEMGLAYCMCC